MVPILLGLIACILLFGPVGLGVFAGIMIYILPIYFVFYLKRVIADHINKHRQKDKLVVQAQRGKVTLLHKDGKWVAASQKPRNS